MAALAACFGILVHLSSDVSTVVAVAVMAVVARIVGALAHRVGRGGQKGGGNMCGLTHPLPSAVL